MREYSNSAHKWWSPLFALQHIHRSILFSSRRRRGQAEEGVDQAFRACTTSAARGCWSCMNMLQAGWPRVMSVNPFQDSRELQLSSGPQGRIFCAGHFLDCIFRSEMECKSSDTTLTFRGGEAAKRRCAEVDHKTVNSATDKAVTLFSIEC